MDDETKVSVTEDLATALIDARGPEDDFDAQRYRAVVEQRLFQTSPAPVTIARYVLLERLGGGTGGSVHRAYDPELDRKVALKLLWRTDSGGPNPGGLMAREAHALARLSHPNVIAVYDFGVVDRQVYIAMELIEGEDLRAWIRRRHSWREVRDVFVAAARGLAAAHAAGLVHRDFKPANVLRGVDGRVCVGDFGLAKDVTQRDLGRSSGEHELTGAATEQTQSGKVLGTPAYMPPEQHAGGVVAAPGDQYALCVAMFEALHGIRPFAGVSIAALWDAKADGRIAPTPSGTGVPRWLQRAVRKGLNPDPGRRHASMNDLVIALDRDPGRAAVGWLSGATLLVGGSIAAFSVGAARNDPCDTVDDALRGVWDDRVRGSIQDAFARTGQEYSDASWRRVRVALDDYVGQWRTRRVEVCRAEQAVHDDPEIARERICLDQRVAALAELTSLLARADGAIMQHAHDAIDTLPDPAGCESRGRMGARSDLSVEQVAAVNVPLARARALDAAGKLEEARAVATSALGVARELRYAEGEAASLLVLGRTTDNAGDPAGAERLLIEAIAAAEASGADRIVAEALVELSYVVGVGGGRYEEALRWAEVATGKVERIGDEPRLRAALHVHRGIVLTGVGRLDAALRAHERAISIRRESGQPDSLAVASSLNNVGNVLLAQGTNELALQRFRESLEIYEERLGPDHPQTTLPRGNVATALIRLKRYDEAEPMLHQLMEEMRGSFGPTHPNIAALLNSLGLVQMRRGKHGLARETYAEGLEVARATLGADHPSAIGFHTNIGEAMRMEGRLDEALVEHQRAVDGWVSATGPDFPGLAHAYINIGRVHVDAGRQQEAQAAFERALLLRERTLGVDAPLTVEIRELVAEGASAL